MLDAQLAALQQRREELTMVTPLTLLIGGGVVAVVGLAMIGAGSCATYADGTKVNPSCADNNNLVTPGAFMFLAGAVGVAVGIPMTISRSVKRHIVNHQIQSRQLEVNALRGLQPRVGFAPTPDGGGTFSLALDF